MRRRRGSASLPGHRRGEGRGGEERRGRLAGNCHLPRRSDDQTEGRDRPLPGLAEEKLPGPPLREERPSAEGSTGRP